MLNKIVHFSIYFLIIQSFVYSIPQPNNNEPQEKFPVTHDGGIYDPVVQVDLDLSAGVPGEDIPGLGKPGFGQGGSGSGSGGGGNGGGNGGGHGGGHGGGNSGGTFHWWDWWTWWLPKPSSSGQNNGNFNWLDLWTWWLPKPSSSGHGSGFNLSDWWSGLIKWFLGFFGIHF